MFVSFSNLYFLLDIYLNFDNLILLNFINSFWQNFWFEYYILHLILLYILWNIICTLYIFNLLWWLFLLLVIICIYICVFQLELFACFLFVSEFVVLIFFCTFFINLGYRFSLKHYYFNITNLYMLYWISLILIIVFYCISDILMLYDLNELVLIDLNIYELTSSFIYNDLLFFYNLFYVYHIMLYILIGLILFLLTLVLLFYVWIFFTISINRDEYMYETYGFIQKSWYYGEIICFFLRMNKEDKKKVKNFYISRYVK